ncbi:hypothetical protein [Kineosporia succinea]|uniref:WXG100 family type VII secretion target n=1 Tax=Kineosporia succinea TaxID=84632 RepID=A0ABT9PD69_9ACTN|nr:hypothetical protein [Kineosporia succinea]MDP9830648.1 hypothetical protein [Kineosporia succinea]
MADAFGVDAQVAGQVARNLADIRNSFNDLKNVFGSGGGVTGSARVQRALDDFADQSSDVREKLDGMLERASGMMSGLATGAQQLDQGLADAATVDPAAAQSQAQAAAGAA